MRRREGKEPCEEGPGEAGRKMAEAKRVKLYRQQEGGRKLREYFPDA